jgi:hypothetical protein
MTRLDDYRSALHVGFSEVPDENLMRALEESGSDFASFIIDHGLGPTWHARTGREEFRDSRLAAEALYAAQERALGEMDTLLGEAGIEYVLFKGAANRLLLYDNPAVRACHDLDLLVRADDRIRAASALVKAGYEALPDEQSISRELVLSRGGVDIDLHWGLLREGRLKGDPVAQMLDRRRRVSGLWMLDSEDALFTLLVHPAFAKHLAAWEMGLHRVLDIAVWVRSQSSNWPAVYARLNEHGVRTAAWATLRWVALLMAPHSPDGLDEMLADLKPGRLRAAWINRWLQDDLSARMSHAHWARLAGFSLFLHDTPHDSARALLGQRKAHRRRCDDLAAFQELLGQ